jgi:hypothetical protein
VPVGYARGMRNLKLLPSLLAIGCGTMNSARPLSPGQQQLGLTLGGAMVDLGAPIPLPNAVVEGRFGLVEPLDRPLDLNAGLNLTAIAYGQVGVHVGASWLLLAPQGARPALSVADRVFLYDNHLDTTKDERATWLLDQVELTASWDLGPHLLYLGGAQYTDLRNPQLFLSPFLGFELHPRQGRLGVQLEGRYYGATTLPDAEIVAWVGPPRGALGATVGVSWRFFDPAEDGQ